MNKSLEIKKRQTNVIARQSGLRKSSNLRNSYNRSKSERYSEGLNYRPKSKIGNRRESVSPNNEGDLIKSYTVRTRGGKNGLEDKINQDSFIANYMLNGSQENHLFGVYDGHGKNPLKINGLLLFRLMFDSDEFRIIYS